MYTMYVLSACSLCGGVLYKQCTSSTLIVHMYIIDSERLFTVARLYCHAVYYGI